VRAFQRCEADSECVFVYVECPLGCSYGVNAKHASEVEEKARELVEDWMSGGAYCGGPGCTRAEGVKPLCEDNVCLSAWESSVRQD
jgi:hypothetical protein